MQAAADLAETVEVSGVASVIDRMLASAEDVATVTAVRILEHARAPMARWDVRDFERAFAVRIPPLHLNDLFEAKIRDEIEDMMRNDERRRAASFAARLARDGAQRLAMKMIEM